MRDLRRYGAIGNLIADDTAAINAACLVASTQGGGDIWVDGTLRCLVNSANIAVGNNTRLTGPHIRPGLFQPYTTVGLQAQGGAIWLNTSYSIQLAPGTGSGSSVAGNAAVSGLYIIAKGTVVPTSAGQAAAVVAAFAGTAVTIVGTTTTGDLTGIDCYVGHCCILGFQYAIYGAISDRTVIEYVSGDNTNGIYLNNTNDLARISHCHFWDFLTYYYIAESWRSGSAYFLDTAAEGVQLIGNFCYGYIIGFNVQAPSVVLTNCWADADQALTQANSMSFNLVGNDIKLIGCQASSHEYGYYINSGGFVEMQGCSSWGAPSNCAYNIYVNEVGYLRIQGGMIWGSATGLTLPSTAFIGMASANIVSYSIDGVTFWAQGVPASNVPAFSISGAAAFVGNIGQNCIYAGACSGPTETQDVRNIQTTGSPIYPNIHARFSYGGATGFTDNILQAGGGPGAGTTSSNNVSVYKINAFGSAGAGGFFPAASMRFQLAAVPTTTASPGIIILSTTSTGAVIETDAVLVDDAQNFCPVTDDAVSCGKSGARWSTVWAANGSIQTSDARAKNVVGEVPGLSFVKLLKPVRYSWKIGGNKVIRQKYHDAMTGEEIPEGMAVPRNAIAGALVTKAVPGKRIHWGLIAQDVKVAADQVGSDFGGYIKTDSANPTSDEGLRYDQFIAPLVKAIQEQQAQILALQAEMAALKK